MPILEKGRFVFSMIFTVISLSFLLISFNKAKLSSPYESQAQSNHINSQSHYSEHLRLQHISDKQPVIDELTHLGLTPNHAVEILSQDNSDVDTRRRTIIHGRFLHITDMHPDELNIIGSSQKRKCHAIQKDTKESEKCHKFGDAMSGCDSPMDLYSSTLDWIRENLKDKIDFVIWTGDNIRHDNDRSNPRLEIDIFDMNQRVSDDMAKTFMDDGEEDLMPLERRVKIVPSLGNNDVYPHNLFAPGPTLQTREMYKIWRNFVPTEQMHTFDRGVYFFREVIPGKLAVMSINSLYLFQSNPLNDNCDNRKQPGYKLFQWLGVTLKELRRRGMKVWLSGHVPPVPKNLHHSCYAKMSVWMHEYRDIIIGGVWGHMNIDHFVPLDSVKAWRSIQKRLIKLGLNEDASLLNFTNYDELEQSLIDDAIYEDDEGDEFEEQEEQEDYYDVIDLYKGMGLLADEDDLEFEASGRYDNAPSGKVTYLESIRDSIFTKIKGKKKSGRHYERYSLTHVSASVIPTFNPGIRVWEYNITDLYNPKSETFESWDDFFKDLESYNESEDLLDLLMDENDTGYTKSVYSLSSDSTIPKPMPMDNPLGPAFTPQLFSPEKYVQYYVNLNKLNLEKDQNGLLLNYTVQYATDDESYNMKSLLVKDWIKLAKKLAQSSDNEGTQKLSKKTEKLWTDYLDRAFIGTGYQDFSFAKG